MGCPCFRSRPIDDDVRPRPSSLSRLFHHHHHPHQPTEKHYVKAVSGYSAALSLDPTSAVLYSNRAAAHLKLENYGSALADAGKAIELDPRYVKAYYRRADASAGLGRVRDALRDFRTAAKVAPNDPDLKVKLKQAEKEVARLRFEAAIAVPDADAIPVAERVELSSMPVEPSYAGPRMEGSEEKGFTITKEFVEEMVEAFRQQKKIHKRFAFEIVLTAQKILKELPPLVDVPVPRGKHLTVRRERGKERERKRGRERSFELKKQKQKTKTHPLSLSPSQKTPLHQNTRSAATSTASSTTSSTSSSSPAALPPMQTPSSSTATLSTAAASRQRSSSLSLPTSACIRRACTWRGATTRRPG